MAKEDLIPVYTRDDSKDYLKVLKALNEIPFPVGKNLLADFLTGDYSNKSIEKNSLFEKHNFNSLRYEKTEVKNLIEKLIAKGMIDVSGTEQNKFWKVLSITRKGQEELMSPSLNKNNIKEKSNFEKTEITEEDKRKFKEIGSFLEKFNDEQKKAIISENKKILCVAGAGSGKTTVLTKRIEFLVKYKNIKPEKILAITFTRKARQEMEKRLKKLGILNANIETFNSFCEKILRKHEDEIYGEKIKVESYSEKINLFMEVLQTLEIEVNDAIETYFSENQKRNYENEKLFNMLMNDCFFILEYFKILNEEMYDFSEDLEEEKESGEMVYKICKKLKYFRKERNLRSFNDQILETIKFFKNTNKIPLFKHVLVDEFQDVNAMQVEILDLLNPENLFCVGDPRQSIFGWRGSNINYILEFPKKYENSEIIALTKNYRSDKNIVKFMNSCIKELGLPDLEHNFESEKEIYLEKFDSEEEEFEFIIDEIQDLGVEKNEIFVLARTNRQLKELSKRMKQKNLSHIIKEEGKNVKVRENEVLLGTVHSIKGMEAEIVFVVGSNTSNFPCKASDHPVIDMLKVEDYDKEDEEKRLFYVAISRAKKSLYITHTSKPTYFLNREMKGMLD